MPLAERIELTRYLTALETEDELRVLLSQRMRAMYAGQSVSLDIAPSSTAGECASGSTALWMK
jgi:hypothetical protein